MARTFGILLQCWEVSTMGVPARRGRHAGGACTGQDSGGFPPRFVQHWDPASFGHPWLHDYPSAPPERRIDLDLHASPLPPAPRSPLALAFYWVRWLPRAAQDVPVFLPGFKAERLVEVPVAPAPAAAGTVWRAVLHPLSLSKWQPSTASALVSPDEHLVRIAFELHTVHGSGRGEIDQQGCDGSPLPPRDERR